MKKITKINWLASALICTTALLACGGGGGGGGTASTPTPPDVTLRGTAAAGAPMANANIKLIDKNGQTLTTTADAGGAYQFNDISGMVRPLLLVAQGNLGGIDTTFMSLVLSNGGNRANITPLTDAIVSQGTGHNGPTALVQSPSLLNAIDQSKVELSATNIASSIANVLEALRAGSSTNYSPLGTSFVADGSDPFDKVHDLLATYVIPGIGSGGLDITLVDKSGTRGGAVIANPLSTRQTTSVSALPSEITALKFDKVKDFFETFNTYTNSASTLTNPSGAFAALFDTNYADYGQTKSQLLAISPSPFLNTTLSNPVIQSCKTNGTCLVTFKQSFPNQSPTKGEFNLKWDNTAQKWTSIGHGSDDLIVDFDTYAQLNLSDPSHPIYTVLSFNIRNKANTLPFYTAEASFIAPNNTTDLTLNFASNSSCETGLTNATLANGLPLQGATNCESWKFYTTTSDINALKQINQKILAGGYTLKVRANLKTNHATYVEMVKPLTQPFVTNDQVNESSFPQITVRAGSGSTLPSIEIANYADFSVAGYTCFSTSNISCANYGSDKLTELTDNYTQLSSQNISPKSSDGWSGNHVINSLVLTVRDRNNRKLRVVQ